MTQKNERPQPNFFADQCHCPRDGARKQKIAIVLCSPCSLLFTLYSLLFYFCEGELVQNSPDGRENAGAIQGLSAH